MTLQEFTRDIVPIIQAILTAVGLGSVLLLWWQIRLTWKWNKVDATFRSMDIIEFSRIESEALLAAKKLGVNLTAPISEDDARKIRQDYETYLKVKALVIFLDRQAVAFLAGYFDSSVVANTYGQLISGYAKTLSNYIRVTRVELGDPEPYMDLQKAAEILEKESAERIRKRGGDGIGKRL